MGINLTKTWNYLKRINQDKKSLLFIFLWGLIFDIAWIIPAFDILSLIGPIFAPFQKLLISPFLGLFLIRTYNPRNMLIFALAISFFVSAFFSVIYIFFHCKAYNIVIKKVLNFKSVINIKDLFFEKFENLKKYFVWEIYCFFIKCFISFPYFFWAYFVADFERIEHILISIVAWSVFLAVDLYNIVTRIFVVPVFISEKYEELKNVELFDLSKRIFSIKLVLPSMILGFIFITSNFFVIFCFTIITCIFEFCGTSWVLSAVVYLAFIFVTSCFSYRVGLFAFIYSSCCQELIFPDKPLMLTTFSEEGKIENIYSIFEKDKLDED